MGIRFALLLCAPAAAWPSVAEAGFRERPTVVRDGGPFSAQPKQFAASLATRFTAS